MCAGIYEAMQGGKRKNRWEFGVQKFWDGRCGRFAEGQFLEVRSLRVPGGDDNYLDSSSVKWDDGNPQDLEPVGLPSCCIEN